MLVSKFGLEPNNYTPVEFQDLVDIAAQCPEDGGDAVYQARSMLSESDYVEENCLAPAAIRSASNNDVEPVVNQKRALVYPNPNNGQFFIELQEQDYPQEVLTLNLYNTLGVQVYQKTLNSNAKQQIAVEHLPKGIYIFEIADKNKILKQEKILIFK